MNFTHPHQIDTWLPSRTICNEALPKMTLSIGNSHSVHYNTFKSFTVHYNMPELPEVETIMRGLAPQLEGAIIRDVIIRQHQLRWPIPSHLKTSVCQQKIIKLARRGKYLLIQFTHGTLIIHLGMSGSLRIVNINTLPTRHDHIDIIFSTQQLLRYNDPRRFGAVLWTEDEPLHHPLLKSMGLEPAVPP